MTKRNYSIKRGSTAVAAAVLLLASVLGISAAGADEHEVVVDPTLMVIDASGEESFVLVRTAEEPSRVDVTIGGEVASVESPVAVADSGLQVVTSIVIDNSADASEYLGAFIDAAASYVRAAPRNEDISIWTTGGTARVRVGLNSDHDRTLEIIENLLTASGGSQLFDGIRAAALEMESTAAGTTNVIVFAGSADAGSASLAVDARGAVQAIDGSAFAVSASDLASSTLSLLVSSSFGGGFAATSDLAEISGYGTSVSQVVQSTWKVDFTVPEGIVSNQIEVSVDGFVIEASYSAGSVASGRALVPFVPKGEGGIPGFGFLSGDTGKTVGLALGALAAALGAYAVVMLFQEDESALANLLQAYSEPGTVDFAEDEEENAISRIAILKRAVELTEGLAERRGVSARLEGTLERANLPLRAGEALTGYAGIALGSIILGFLLLGSLPGMIIFAFLGIAGPPLFVKTRAGRRRKAFMAQLPDTLQLLSSTLKAGYSFMQGVEAVSKEVEDPMGAELRRIVTEAQLGRPLEEAMDASAERMDSADFGWAVMAVRIQREVGGNLSELLTTVGQTMTERERLRRDISTLTAEGKMSAIVLGALPILLGVAMWAINPEYIDTLFTDSLGKILLGGATLAALAGFAWMKKIINIDI